MGNKNNLSIAFAKQSKSDKIIYNLLASNNKLPSCHGLHYLQMCLEKISKAHIYYSNKILNLNEITKSHNYIAKILPQLYKDYCIRNNRNINSIKNELKKIKLICKEIDYLNPSIDDDKKRPDNCEYPWIIGNQNDKIFIPTEFNFPILDDLKKPIGLRFLKIIFSIIDRY